MERNYQNLSSAAAAAPEDDDCDTNKNTACFKLFGAVINVCNNPENGEEEERVVIEKKCSSSSSGITTVVESYPRVDSVKNDVVILSDDEELEEQSRIWKRKRGESWSEEEHRLFLAGLEKLGSGRWKRIAEEFVPTRTSTQVASHAQKYFMRQASASNGGSIQRRGSIFNSTPTKSLGTNVVGESSVPAANRVAPLPEVGPIIHVPCRVVRAGGKVKLVPLFKTMPYFATMNN